MGEIKSGKELCDEFFANLANVEGVELDVGNILQLLYDEGRLTADAVLSALKCMREGDEDETG